MSFPQDIFERLSALPVRSGMLIQGEKESFVTCFIKLPLRKKLSRKAIRYTHVEHQVDTSYTSLAFQGGTSLFFLQVIVGWSTVLIDQAVGWKFSCALDLRLGDAQQLMQVLLQSRYLALVVVADDQEHTVVLRQNIEVDDEEREKMAQSVGEVMLKARGVGANWANTSLGKENWQGPSPNTKFPGLFTYTHRVNALHVRQYTFVPYHHISPLNTKEQELAQTLAIMTHQMDRATCEQARSPRVTPLMAHLIDEQLQRPLLFPVTLPLSHLWVEAPHTPRSQGIRKASGVLLSSPKLAYAQAKNTWFSQGMAEHMLQEHIQRLGNAWRLDVIDSHGFPSLRLLYLPSKALWMISQTHQCPKQQCVIRANEGTGLFFGDFAISPCQQCERELVWWQQYISASLPIILEALKAEDQEQAWLLQEDRNIQATRPRPQSQTDPLRLLPADVHYALYPLAQSIQRNRTLTGIPALLAHVQENPSVEMLLASKLPTHIPYSTSSVILGLPEAHTYRPQGPLVCLPLLIQSTEAEDTVVSFLLSPMDEKDAQYLELLSSHDTGRIWFIALSDEEEPQLLGQHWFMWNSDMQRSFHDARERVNYYKQGTPGAAKARWWREHPNGQYETKKQGISLDAPAPETGPQPPRSDEPLPAHLAPKTLLEQYLAYLLQHKGTSEEATAKSIASLKRTYDCQLDNDALQLLRFLIKQQTPDGGKLLTFGATHVWFQFPVSIPSTFGHTSLEVVALWFTRETPASSFARWSCVLVDAKAHPLGVTYSYAPARNPHWTVAAGYRCPDQLCQKATGSETGEDIWHLCEECERSLSFWATSVHVLLRMLRGDYRCRDEDEEKSDYPIFKIDEDTVTDKRVARTPRGLWTAATVTRTVHSLRTIDATLQFASPGKGVIGSRPSWLSILQETRPDLIETEKVPTRGSVRHVKKTGTNYSVGSYSKTTHRVRGRGRTTRMESRRKKQQDVQDTSS